MTQKIQVEGGRITLPPSSPGERPIIYEFGEQLKSYREETDGFVIEQSLPNSNTTLVQKRRYLDGHTIWSLVIRQSGELAASSDNRTLTLDGVTSIRLPAALLFARLLPEGAAVLVQPSEAVGNRNLFLYDHQGTCKWQVQQWPRFQHFYIQSVRELSDTMRNVIPRIKRHIGAVVADETQALFGVLFYGGQALIIDRSDGAVLDQIDWKD